MRTLADVRPTSEQLALFSRIRSGVEVIRGAAGSGKTTTAILKLRSSLGQYIRKRQRSGSDEPVRILVLTYNRTLRGYINELTTRQINDSDPIVLEVTTFSKWARNLLGAPLILSTVDKNRIIRSLVNDIPIEKDFLIEEVDYACGRFLPEQLDDYLDARRHGRGPMPRVEKSLRKRILEEVVAPYQAQKLSLGRKDWNDLAVDLASSKIRSYDVVVADEVQDFSANEIRGVLNQLNDPHTVTFVLDSAQRIYARGFTWSEVGVVIRPENSHRLGKNYRNTIEIAQFAASMIKGLELDVDGTFPDFKTAQNHGPLPEVVVGKFSAQVRYALSHIKKNIDLALESVAFLHPKGHGYFDYLRGQLVKADLKFVELTRTPDWPKGSENIGLSTLHSAKGLEFDHVIILGLNAEVLPHGDDELDNQLTVYRRLLAMGISRARKTVMLGYKAEDAPKVLEYLDNATYQAVTV